VGTGTAHTTTGFIWHERLLFQLLGPQSSAFCSFNRGMTTSPNVRLGRDLVLHPAKLQRAYWQHQAMRWMLWDLQVR
jgi:hypothetical protein